MPDNYQLSVNRLQGLLRRLKQDPTILKEYDAIIRDQLRKGIIEAVPADEAPLRTTHYLPHLAIAFWMVSVDEADRDILRFIWVEDTTKDRLT